MGILLAAFAPILVLMALPLVIPIVGVSIGAVMDRLAPRSHSAAEDAVNEAQVRTAEWRAGLAREELAREQAASAKLPV